MRNKSIISSSTYPAEKNPCTYLLCFYHFRTRENESQLLHQAKQYTATLEGQGNDLETADNFPEGTDTDVSRMRQQLLKYRNELAQIDERQYQHEYKIEW